MSLIQISGLTFGYDSSPDNVFENFTLQISTDWKLGLVGRNGRGKTTLLRLLAGEYECRGTISADVGFDMFPYDIPDEAVTVYGLAGSVFPEFEDWRLERELKLLSFPDEALARPVSTLSPGERIKAALATLFIGEHSFLLIDEPTNHLDADGRKTVSKYLNDKNGYIIVSHDRAFLDGCVDHILALNREGYDLQQGNFSSWKLNRDLRDGYELAESEKLKKEVAKLSKAARTTGEWSSKTEASKIGAHAADRGYIGHKSAKMMSRSKSLERRRERAYEEKASLLKNTEEAGPLKLHPLRYHSDLLFEAEDLSISYGDKTVFSGLKFAVRRGDRIALRGKNGSGKTSVVKLLCGEEVCHAGVFRRGSGLKISWLPQDTSFLMGDMRRFITDNQLDESLFKAILRKLDFSRGQFDKELEELSGGQKKKILLAKSLCESAHIYIWDEPLNFIDLLSRIQIEELIVDFQPTMVFVEHDEAFCERIATTELLIGG